MALINDKQKKVENRPEQMSYRKRSRDLPWRGSAWLLAAASGFAYQPPRRPVLQAPPSWCAVYRSPSRAEGDFWSWRKASGFDVGSSGRHGFECGIDMKRTRKDFPAHEAFEHCLWRAGPFLRPPAPCKVWGDKGLPETHIPQPLPFNLCWGHNCLASEISRYTKQNKTSLIRRERKVQLCHFSVWRPWKMFWFPHDREPRTLGQKPSKQNTPGFNNLAFKFSN